MIAAVNAHQVSGRWFTKIIVFSIEKLNIFIKILIVSIEKLNISIEKLNISIKKPIISIKKANISIEKPNISIEKVIISIKKTNISIEKMKKLTVFGRFVRAIFSYKPSSLRSYNPQPQQPDEKAETRPAGSVPFRLAKS